MIVGESISRSAQLCEGRVQTKIGEFNNLPESLNPPPDEPCPGEKAGRRMAMYSAPSSPGVL